MVTIDEIKNAHSVIKDKIIKTPTTFSSILGAEAGCELYLKLENLQRTGAYKFRGAYNKLYHLSDEDKKKGVIAASAGNHSQGLAQASTYLNVDCKVVMPKSAPLSKIKGTKTRGADVVLYGDCFDDAYAHARELEKKEGRVFVHPYADVDIMAGQGTIGIEVVESLKTLDVIVVPVGGGGLISGIAVAVKSLLPNVRVIGVEAKRAAAMSAALENDKVVTIDAEKTMADGIAVKEVKQLSFDIVKQYVDEIVTVTEEEIAQSVFKLLEVEKVVAEGAGACACAAILNGKVKNIAGKKVCAIVSGGNLDLNFLQKIINMGRIKEGRLANLEVRLPDVPGSLAKTLDTLANAGGNVTEVQHKRGSSSAVSGRVSVQIRLECVDREHQDKLLKSLSDKGIEVKFIPDF